VSRARTILDPCDRSTWPEVLFRVDLMAILRCGHTSLDERQKAGLLPARLPGTSTRDVRYAKATVCEWLDNPRVSGRGLRDARPPRSRRRAA
jgi:hypothetical protein